MSFVALTLLGQAAIILAPPMPTLESMTEDSYRFDCVVRDARGGQYRLVLAQDGGRGLRNPDADPNDLAARRAGQTRISSRVVEDETSTLAGLEMGGSLVYRPGMGSGAKVSTLYGRDVRAEIRLDELASQSYAITIKQTFSEIPARVVGLVGFCSAMSTPQRPLSDPEAKAYLAK